MNSRSHWTARIRGVFALGMALVVVVVVIAGCERPQSAPSQSAGSSPPPPRGPSTRFAGSAAEVEKRVVALVAEQMGMQAQEITARSRLVEDLKMDELDHVE